VTRIANPGDEDRFLELARCTTGAQLAREYRYTEKNLAAKSAMGAHEERTFYGSFNDDSHYRFRGLLGCTFPGCTQRRFLAVPA
jgi:hypothetical protein